MKNTKPLRYIAYVRKSEERKERQELSHEAQISKIKQTFPDLNIVRWMEPESKSAFEEGRPIFNEVIDLIKRGEADGIVAWHPNRLSRNEIDAATITHMLRKKKMADVKFCTSNFENTAEGIWMLQMLLSQSQYESSKQGRDVTRGMEQKASNGERPGIVPTGYMKVPIAEADGSFVMKKDKLATRTTQDPERIELVKRMWQMLLSGAYTAPQIRKIANNDWGYTLRKTVRTGGGPIGHSSIYRIFTNPFYAGYIRHNGELHKGNHKPIITPEEYDYAQHLLGKKGKPRSNKNEYAYSGLMNCGECGCRIVGKTNQKILKRSGKLMTYVHYHCTRRSEKRPCNQTEYTSVESLENEIATELSKYEILPEFRDLALDILRRDNELEVKDRTNIYKAQHKRREALQADLDRLVDMRLHGELDQDEYVNKRTSLKTQLESMDSELRSTESRADDWLQLTEQAFNFAVYAPAHFRDTNDLQVKREILMTLGANFTLKDRKLTLEPHPWLIPIRDSYKELETEYLNARTAEKPLVSQNVDVNNSWRAIWDSNPGHGD